MDENRNYPQIDAFAELMRARMECNSYKDEIGYKKLSDLVMLEMLQRNLRDLENMVIGDAEWAHDDYAVDQLLDIANYAMMLADNSGILKD